MPVSLLSMVEQAAAGSAGMLTRRQFLRGSLAVAALAGCGGSGADGGKDDPLAQGDASPVDCPDPLAGAELVGTLPLLDSLGPDPGRLYGTGLDARLMTDLAAIRPDALVTPLELYYLRTATPDALPAAETWTVRIDGLVERPIDIPIAEIVSAARDRGVFVMECSGNNAGSAFGLISAGRWRGVPIGAVLDRVRPQGQAARLLFTGYDRHDGPSETSYAGASWIFSRAELESAGAFLATHLDDAPLSPEHGAPVRLYVPGWYGCTCVKWLQRIDFVADDVAPTFHMLEFAHRTMQDGEPKMARDWAPAIIDQAAMPVRIEKWRVGEGFRYLVAGVMWGGSKPTDKIDVRFSADDMWRRADVCPPAATNASWTTWTTIWDPPGPGTYEITCRIDDPTIRQRRLDVGWYLRRVKIT